MAPTTMAAMTTTSFSARMCRGASCRDAALASEGAPEAAARQASDSATPEAEARPRFGQERAAISASSS
eukprot:5575029-Pyramimonas_sp.AAC.1